MVVWISGNRYLANYYSLADYLFFLVVFELLLMLYEEPSDARHYSDIHTLPTASSLNLICLTLVTLSVYSLFSYPIVIVLSQIA